MHKYPIKVYAREKELEEHLNKHHPIGKYLKELVITDMDTHRAWAICMGVMIASEEARTYHWTDLEEKFKALAEELGQKLGLAPDEVRRQAHQVMERERL